MNMEIIESLREVEVFILQSFSKRFKRSKLDGSMPVYGVKE